MIIILSSLLLASPGKELVVFFSIVLVFLAGGGILSYRLHRTRKEFLQGTETIRNLQSRLAELEGEVLSQEKAGELSPVNSDRRRFLLLDEAIEKERLFALPDITRDKLAELMGVDRNEFARIIRKESGCRNMSDYLNRKRMAYVVEMMQTRPNYTLEAIAKDCGIRSISTFNRVFKDYFGVSPSKYRNTLTISAVEGGGKTT